MRMHIFFLLFKRCKSFFLFHKVLFVFYLIKLIYFIHVFMEFN
uniref:Uncharacterized protein n=1 Tax=Manihot esculenta TaxID=3983 RepID=A0A2C9U4M6_MANES